MRKSLFFTLLITLSFYAYAIDGLVIRTIDYSLKDKWNNTLGSTGPKINTIESVYRKQYFYLTAVAWDFILDEQGMANVQYNIKMIKPDRSIYFYRENLTLINQKISNRNYLQMSEAIIKICFEDEDELGKYEIEASIVDLVSGNSKTLNYDIHLLDLPQYDHYLVKDGNTLMNWLERYYENPNPHTALSHYLFYAQSPMAEDESNFPAIFGTFVEIFGNNPFLLPQVTQCYDQQNENIKIFLLYLLHYSQIGNPDFFERLEGIEKDAYMSIMDVPLPDMYGDIYDGAQLDMLWSTFMASGSYKPIYKLIQTLEYTKYKGYLDRYKKSKKTEEDTQKAIKNAIYDALVWSISSNCQQHKLVKDYCRWALRFENLTEIQKSELAKILQKVN